MLGVDEVFKALADPTRRELLDELFRRDGQTLGTLEENFSMTRFGVMKHLKVLEHAGLVKRGREAQWRPCHLDAGPLKDAAEWLEHYRQFWEQSFDRLADYLDELQAKEEKDGHEDEH